MPLSQKNGLNGIRLKLSAALRKPQALSPKSDTKPQSIAGVFGPSGRVFGKLLVFP